MLFSEGEFSDIQMMQSNDATNRRKTTSLEDSSLNSDGQLGILSVSRSMESRSDMSQAHFFMLSSVAAEDHTHEVIHGTAAH